MKERLEELNPWWGQGFKHKTIERPKYLDILKKNLKDKNITVLTGIRRVGKTTLLKQLISHLLDTDTDPKHILFVSLDLLYFSDYTIQDIVLEYKRIQNISHAKKTYLILDEVTYKENFNQELKNLYDLGNYKIYASASSAKVLKDNKAFLTGRARYVEVEPLDFHEFLVFKGKDEKKAETHILRNLFEQYMRFGGMPEYVLTQDPTYLSLLLEMIVAKDIVAEHNIKSSQLVYDLFRLLCERVGKQVSYNKISKILGVDNETVSRYISYFLDTYLFDIIEVEGKINERIKGKKKMYCIDVGLRNSITGFRDKGAIYENLVYNSIKKNGPRFLYRQGIELDFVFGDTLIEAKYGQELSSEQKRLFDEARYKTKIVAKGMDFFMDRTKR